MIPENNFQKYFMLVAYAICFLGGIFFFLLPDNGARGAAIFLGVLFFSTGIFGSIWYFFTGYFAHSDEY